MSNYYDQAAALTQSNILLGSVFCHKLDNKPDLISATWTDLVWLLRDLSTIPRDPVEKDGLRDECGNWQIWPSAPAVCPAEYAEGSLRRKVNVLRWHWFGADIDNDQGDEGYVSLSEMKAILHSEGLANVLHTTTKSRPGRDRYRLLMPLLRPIEASEFSLAWDSANQFFGRVFDSTTHDLSRLLFAPAAWAGSNVQFEVSDGAAFDIDAVMSSYPPERAKAKIELDCPILPQRVRELADACARPSWMQPVAGASIFLTPKMERDFLSSPPGGRLMRLMTQIAMHAISKGYPINEMELTSVALSFDAVMTGKCREDVPREACRALSFAAQAVASSTNFESRYARNLKRFAEGC